MCRLVLLLILMLAACGCLSAPPSELPVQTTVSLLTTIPTPAQATVPETPAPHSHDGTHNHPDTNARSYPHTAVGGCTQCTDR